MVTRLASLARRLQGWSFFIVSILVLCWLSADRSFAEEAGALPGYRSWTGDFDGMAKRRLIRILVPFSKTIYFIDRGEQLGTAVEAGNALADDLNRGRKKEIELDCTCWKITKKLISVG